MLNQKGQAFDAFKLLIAAVVAGAILVILLSMISGFTAVGSEPHQVMSQELNKVKQGGIASTSAGVVRFLAGTEYEADSIAKDAGLNTGSVLFCCASTADDHCDGYRFTDADAFECGSGDAVLIINEDMTGRIRAYCPSSSSEKCIIGFKEARA